MGAGEHKDQSNGNMDVYRMVLSTVSSGLKKGKEIKIQGLGRGPIGTNDLLLVYL